MSHDAACYDPTACNRVYGQYGYDATAHEQPVYGYTQARTSAITSKPEDITPKSHDRVTTAMLITCILVAAIAIVAVIALFVLSIAAIGFRFGTETPFPESTDVPLLPSADPVVRLPSHSSVVTTTDATMTPAASTKSPRTVMDEQPLVCTMGSKTSSPEMFPPDGLCEYVFFDSMEKDNRNPLAVPYHWDHDLRIFIASYARYTITAFGIGFAYDKAPSLLQQLTATNSSLLEPFWKRGIFHFGILDTATRNARRADVKLALDFLKALDTHAGTQRQQGNPSFIFFAGVAFNAKWTNFYSERFTKVYKPDLFIGQGHYFHGDNTFPDCRVMPPTAFTRPQGLDSAYQHDLTMAVGTFRLLSRNGLSLTWALSVTMKGRWTRALPGERREFLSPCVHNASAPSFGRYSEVCGNRRFPQRNYKYTHDGILAAYDTDHALFAYDNEVSLCRKLCIMKAFHPALRFGIAVYDVEYEDFSNTCVGFNKYGAFSRLHAVRRILNYFRTKFNSVSDVRGCRDMIK